MERPTGRVGARLRRSLKRRSFQPREQCAAIESLHKNDAIASETLKANVDAQAAANSAAAIVRVQQEAQAALSHERAAAQAAKRKKLGDKLRVVSKFGSG